MSEAVGLGDVCGDVEGRFKYLYLIVSNRYTKIVGRPDSCFVMCSVHMGTTVPPRLWSVYMECLYVISEDVYG
jgi:hypothetical protein